MGVECRRHSGGDAEGKGHEGVRVERDGGKGGEGRAVVCGRVSCAVGEKGGDDGDGLSGLAEERAEELASVVRFCVDGSAREGAVHGSRSGTVEPAQITS